MRKLKDADVCFGSKADMCSAKGHVRSTPKSGHVQCNSECPLCAKSGHRSTSTAMAHPLGHRNLINGAVRVVRKSLPSPRWQVTIDLKTMADKDNAMPGRIATVPLNLAVWHCKTLSVLDVRATEWFVVACVSDDGDVLIAIHFIAVGPISVCQPTAGQVGLSGRMGPLNHWRISGSVPSH